MPLIHESKKALATGPKRPRREVGEVDKTGDGGLFTYELLTYSKHEAWRKAIHRDWEETGAEARDTGGRRGRSQTSVTEAGERRTSKENG